VFFKKTYKKTAAPIESIKITGRFVPGQVSTPNVYGCADMAIRAGSGEEIFRCLISMFRRNYGTSYEFEVHASE
jgi:hypothetical protein